MMFKAMLLDSSRAVFLHAKDRATAIELATIVLKTGRFFLVGADKNDSSPFFNPPNVRLARRNNQTHLVPRLKVSTSTFQKFKPRPPMVPKVKRKTPWEPKYWCRWCGESITYDERIFCRGTDCRSEFLKDIGKDELPRGFALLSPERRTEIARKAGKKSQASGAGYRLTSERAKELNRIKALRCQTKQINGGVVDATGFSR